MDSQIKKRQLLTVYMPTDLYTCLSDLAVAKRRTISNMVRVLIAEAWEAETAA